MNRPGDDLEGPAGTAHRVPPGRLEPVLSGDEVATRDLWWVHTPGVGIVVAHVDELTAPVADVRSLELMVAPGEMDTYQLAVVTLADLPGVPPARKAWPWVTHELIVFTIDTSTGPCPFDRPLPWPLMHPHNLSVQFQVHDDDQARLVCELMAWALVQGMVPGEVQAFVPERRAVMTLPALHELWAETVAQTAEHVRTGGTHHEDVARD